MKDVFIASDNIVSPLGVTAEDNFAQLKELVSGVKLQAKPSLSEDSFYASLFNEDTFFFKGFSKQTYTRFEKLLIASISDALQKDSGIDTTDKKSVLIISSAKGNISLLETEAYSKQLENRIALNTSANLVAAHFHFANKPIVISNACISGLVAIITGMRLIQSGQYENAVIAGADVISKFVLSGFQSFQAISSTRCKPFDAARNGINLGEGAGTIILSCNKKYDSGIKIAGGSISNDANHISGPSRTGEELNFAITKAMKDANLPATAIDFISAHGTATVYNDEMEANAITLSNLHHVPVNSLKGYFGHTLGAAGIIESVVSLYSLKENTVLPTLGFETPGITKPINICTSLYNTLLQNCLKTASGFGGCNAAIVISKQ
jgi:3-oxoacyl-[acyl-carrier-protein] synthase I